MRTLLEKLVLVPDEDRSQPKTTIIPYTLTKYFVKLLAAGGIKSDAKRIFLLITFFILTVSNSPY